VVSRKDGEDCLPKPNTLRWAHSVCSKDDLKIALLDKEITAIEADIVMGHIEDEKTKDVSPITEPIMSLLPSQYRIYHLPGLSINAWKILRIVLVSNRSISN